MTPEDREVFDRFAARFSAIEPQVPAPAGWAPRSDRRSLVRLRRENNGRRSFALPALLVILILGVVLGLPRVLPSSSDGGGGVPSTASPIAYNLRFVLVLGPMSSLPSGIRIAPVADPSHWSVRLTRSDGTQIGAWDINQGLPRATEVQPGSYQIGAWRTTSVPDALTGSIAISTKMECQANVTVTSGPTITATVTTTMTGCSIAVA